MKKLFVIALIALFMAGDAFATSGPNNPGDILGQGKYPSDPHRIFRFVHISPNDNDTDGVTEDAVVVWDDEFDDGVSVELSSTSLDARVAGILVTTVTSSDSTGAGHAASDDIGTSDWGWLQTYGLYDDGVYADTYGVQTGRTIGNGGTNGACGQFDVYTTNAKSGYCGILGFSLDAITAGGADGDVFITCD